MSRKKDSGANYLAGSKDGLNWGPIENTEDTINITWRLLQIDCDKKVDTKEKSMPLSWKPEDLNWPTVDQESQFQDAFYQKALDKLNGQVAAIFADPISGITTSALNWHIRSTGFSEELKGAETMQLYYTYVIDLKNHAIYPYGPILAENKNPARDQALAWLVSAATVPDFEDVKVFDGEIGHYHIAVVEIAGGIPSKIKEE